MSRCSSGRESFEWAQKASAQGERNGLYQMAIHLYHGRYCDMDEAKGMELMKEAAEAQHAMAMFQYGEWAFDVVDWERYDWWSRSAARGCTVMLALVLSRAATKLLPRFEAGELGRVLHGIGSLIRLGRLDARRRKLFGGPMSAEEVAVLQRVLELHKAMLARARRAIDCWSMAGRRLGVVKDMRVMIAKIVWEEAWQWGETKRAKRSKRAKRT
jgi:hypothetical protein